MIPLLVKQKIPLSRSYSLATAIASRGASGITSAKWKAKGKILEKAMEWNCLSRKMKRNLTN